MNRLETGFTLQPRMATLTRMAAELRARGDAAQTEAVTGRPADLAERLSGRVAETVRLGGALDRLAGHAEAIVLAETRVNVVASGLGELRQLASDLANDADIAIAGNLPQGRSAIAASARAALERAVAVLNLSVGGRSLFAGDATDGPALTGAAAVLGAGDALIATGTSGASAHDALVAGFADTAGVFGGTIYIGGAGPAPRAEIAPGETVALGVRADDPEARALLAQLVVLTRAFDGSTALDSQESDRLARRAVAGLRESADELAGTMGRVGVVQERISLVKARNMAEQAGLAIAVNELSGGDQTAAALRFNAIEGQIGTLFATTARLSGLSLGAFLR
ncbi:hypothetical protein M1105_02170 [Limibaculum sp. FT325]|uniref:hypothetical protein n=1 Tax=Thermohalobaculum sediminis TaxID=2939436 RepID=UPI0020BFAF46|nr:hypothetical protein [Limibaculum sediminis]MCL5775805.1 hypothetical protein [Limibaculum sediminis]